MQNKTTAYPYGPNGSLSHMRQTSPYSPVAVLVGGFGVSMLFAVLSYSTMYSLPWQADMGLVRGTVTDVRMGYKFNSRVKYRYVVNGVAYRAKQTFEIHGHFLKPGDKVDVRYDPKQPAFAFIQSGFTVATIFYALGALAGLLCFIAGFSKTLWNVPV